METLQFKTNIKCGGCLAKVAPHLDEVDSLKGNWEVDIKNPDKILTVTATGEIDAQEICAIVQEAGFTAEAL